MNYLGRTLSVLDLEHLAPLGEVPITGEPLTPAVLRGKILFHNATSRKLSQGGWISCASCHVDGWSDGVTWIFPDGPRQTPPLWNAGQTLPWHWSATLDEAQDVEGTIVTVQHGLGLAPGPDPALLAAPNAGRSADLDALAAYLTRGLRAPQLPFNAGEASGRALFITQGCGACHSGAQWTRSALPGPAGTLDPDGDGMVNAVLHEVGTLNAADRRGQSGFDPPSLLDAGLTGPYLHDGTLPSLEALIASGHPVPGRARLAPAEAGRLAAFVRSIGPDTLPVPDR
jgi:hypothetical protein